jgi:AcrR family transcriptional regulator
MNAAMAAGREGLRERKRRETGERIAAAALTLFFRDGFEATTLDAIAAAADVSRRTVFHYFASKEAIVEAQEAQFETALRTAAAQSSADAPLAAAQEAILQVVGRYETDEVAAVERMMRGSPQLMARKPAGWARKERLLAEGLADRWPDPERAPGLRLVAMAAIGAFRLASEAWSADAGARPPAAYVIAAFERLRRELAA